MKRDYSLEMTPEIREKSKKNLETQTKMETEFQTKMISVQKLQDLKKTEDAHGLIQMEMDSLTMLMDV